MRVENIFSKEGKENNRGQMTSLQECVVIDEKQINTTADFLSSDPCLTTQQQHYRGQINVPIPEVHSTRPVRRGKKVEEEVKPQAISIGLL